MTADPYVMWLLWTIPSVILFTIGSTALVGSILKLPWRVQAWGALEYATGLYAGVIAAQYLGWRLP